MIEKFELSTNSPPRSMFRATSFLSTLDSTGFSIVIRSKVLITLFSQFLFMRIAIGLSYNEKDPTQWAIRFYNKLSRHEYLTGGSTNLGSVCFC